MPHTAAAYRSPVHYDVAVEDNSAETLIAIPHQGDYQEIGKAFERLMVWAGPRGLMGPQTRLIGIYYDDPASKPKGELRSEACITAPADVEPGPGMHRQVIAAGPVARLVHKGPYATSMSPMPISITTGCRARAASPGKRPASRNISTTPAACRRRNG